MTPMRFVLGTRSAHKAEEIRLILEPVPHVEIESLADLGVEPDPDEDGIEVYDTFRENAIAKARYFARKLGRPVIADDSGLEVDALGGGPGVRTKRFAADAGFSRPGLDTDALNNAYLLERLEGVPDAERGARYVCAAALVTPAGDEYTFVGTCPGRITREYRGDGGFGYDPIFYLPDLGRTFAEVPQEEKNRRSHRARAFRALVSRIGDLARALEPTRENC